MWTHIPYSEMDSQYLEMDGQLLAMDISNWNMHSPVHLLISVVHL